MKTDTGRLWHHLRHTGIAAVLFLPKPILLHKEVKALGLFPHVIKRHTFCYCSRCHLRKTNANERVKKHCFVYIFHVHALVKESIKYSLCVSVLGENSCHTSEEHVQSSCIPLQTTEVIFLH